MVPHELQIFLHYSPEVSHGTTLQHFRDSNSISEKNIDDQYSVGVYPNHPQMEEYVCKYMTTLPYVIVDHASNLEWHIIFSHIINESKIIIHIASALLESRRFADPINGYLLHYNIVRG